MSETPIVAPVAKKNLGRKSSLPMTFIITVVPVCVALNIVGGIVNGALKLPLYLDMTGTAISAIVLGPWWGALVGLLTNGGLALTNGPVLLPFAIVNVVGALLWGYGVRYWRMGRTIFRFFLLNIVVAVATTAASAPIVVYVFGGATGAGADSITGVFLAMGQGLMGAVFSANILTSLADRIILGFVALAIIEALPKSLTANVDIIRATPLKSIMGAAIGVVAGVLVLVVYLAINSGS